jgi:CBS-domain-containing membrane protein
VPRVRDVMTRPGVTVSSAATVAAAAQIMQAAGVAALPVLDETGALVGTVTWQDLLSVLVRDDEQIRREILHDILRSHMWLDPCAFEVRVIDGVVHLAGRTEWRSLIPILVHLVREVPGVIGVEEQLTYDHDDLPGRPEDEPALPVAGR